MEIGAPNSLKAPNLDTFSNTLVLKTAPAAQHNKTLHETLARANKPTCSRIDNVSHISGITRNERRSGATFCYKSQCAFTNSPFGDVSRMRTSTSLSKPKPRNQSHYKRTITHTALRPVSTDSTQPNTGTLQRCSPKPFSATTTISICRFCFCQLRSFPHFATHQTRLSDTKYSELRHR